MRNMLLQYYFRNMGPLLFLIPVAVFFYIGISLLFEQSSVAFSSGLIASVIMITLKFLQLSKDNEKMFSVMPIPKHELVQTEFIFLARVTAIYGTLFFTLYLFMSRIEEGWTWKGWMSAAGIALFLSLLIINLLLLIDHLPNQKAASGLMLLLLFALIYALWMLPLYASRAGDIVLNGSMLAIASGTICFITWLNYRVVIYFVTKFDMS